MPMFFQGASQADIRKAYRVLSKVLHPDKKETGDAKAFMRLAKGTVFSIFISTWMSFIIRY